MSVKLETGRLDALRRLAAERFGDLHAGEDNVLKHSVLGENGIQRKLPNREPVSAEFLRWLITDKDAAASLDPRGLRVSNAEIPADLDLESSTIPFPLTFAYCSFARALNLKSAHVRTIDLNESDIAGSLCLANLVADGAVLLRSLHAGSLTDMRQTQIGGSLECTGSHFHVSSAKNPEEPEYAFWGDGVRVSGRAVFDRVQAVGQIRLSGAQIGGGLDFVGAKLAARGGDLSSSERDLVLLIDAATVALDVNLRDNFSSSGRISMIDAVVGRDLVCVNATLTATGQQEIALQADWARIKGNVYLGAGFVSSGEISLYGTQIEGKLDCPGNIMRIMRSKTTTIYALGTKIAGDVLLGDSNGKNSFRSDGTLFFSDAVIGGSMSLYGTVLNSNDAVLLAQRVKITGDLVLTGKLSAAGPIYLTNARVGGDMDISDATLGSVDCQGIHVEGDLKWEGSRNSPCADLRLEAAVVGRLYDKHITWPKKGHLHLNGFTYRDLILDDPQPCDPEDGDCENVKGKSPAAVRICWLRQQPDYELSRPQPWLQLSKWLQEHGDDAGSKAVIYAFRQEQVRGSGWIVEMGSAAMDELGEDPMKIAYPALFLWAVGSLVFWRAGRMKRMAPKEAAAYADFSKSGTAPSHCVRYNPFMYALENVLPVVKLGQDDAWGPDPDRKFGNTYTWLAAVRWALILLGWLIALVLTAAISLRIKS